MLLLVFVLVPTYASWSAAGEGESAEATATLLLFREADLVRDARTRTACTPRSSATPARTSPPTTASARQERLARAPPTVPGALFLLMVLAVAVTLGIFGGVTERSVGRGVQLAIVVATGVVLAATLALVRDLDQHYSGALRRSPSHTEFIRAQIALEVRGPLPCDNDGMPTCAPDFRASTSALR